MSLVTGDHQPMWVRLDGWLVQDGSITLVDVGSVLSDAAVCGIGQTLQLRYPMLTVSKAFRAATPLRRGWLLTG